MEEIEKIADCSICYEMFTDPRILPCIHTFCLKCLQESAFKDKRRAGDKMPCPLCRTEFTIPKDGMNALTKHLFVGKVIEAIKISKQSEGPALCEVCVQAMDDGEDSLPTATSYCIQCRKNICNRCCREHRKYDDLKSHEIVELGSRIKEELIKKFSTQYCNRHSGKKLEMYCDDCKETICLMCFAERHQNHTCSDIEEISLVFRDQLRSQVEKLKVCQKQISQRTDEYNKECREFMDQVESTRTAIIDRGMEIKSLVDQYITSQMNELGQVKERGLIEREVRQQENQEFKVNIESFESYCTLMLNKGSSVEICKEIHDLSSRADELMKTHDTQRNPVAELSYEMSEDVLNVKKFIGKIKA